MSVLVAMLRGVNVGGKHLIKMEALRALWTSLQCSDVATYVQSGNVVFRTSAKDRKALGQQLAAGIEQTFGFPVPVVLRSAADLRKVIAGNPFAAQVQTDPDRVLVTFLYADPGEAGRKAARAHALRIAPEVLRFAGRAVYTYYPVGMGQSKLRWGPIEKALGTAGTSRNWNTVVKLLAMAEGLCVGEG